jgi:nucleotide-binding universal stress UspA family protein
MVDKSGPCVPKIHGIVVGVDGSDSSRVAIDWGAREAAQRRLPLTLVYALPPDIEPWLDIPLSHDYLAARDRHADRVIENAVRAVPHAIDDGKDIAVGHQIVSGHPVRVLVDLSKDADMVVVGSRGRGGVAGVLMGSVSSGLVHHSHCPVAVIREDVWLRNAAETAPVVVGVDGSPASEEATAIAFDEASRRGVTLVAVHTWMNHADFGFAIEWDAVTAQAEEELSQRLAGWCERYPDVQVRSVVTQDNPVHRLLEESVGAQLIVVGSHGRGGFAGLMLGSVSSAVVQKSRTPVIVARK